MHHFRVLLCHVVFLPVSDCWLVGWLVCHQYYTKTTDSLPFNLRAPY